MNNLTLQQGALRIGTIMGIPLRLHYSWFIIFGLITWSLSSYYFPEVAPDLPVASYWLKGALASLLLFASVAFHELAHSYMALRHHLKIVSITLFIFGGVAQMKGEPSNPKAEFQIALAGPLSSFFLSLIFFFLSLSNLSGLSALFHYLARINLILGLFNLIPGFPMDGGRVLRSFLWNQKKDYIYATQKAAGVGKKIALFFIFFGLFSFFMGFPGGVWFLLIGWFVYTAAQSSYQQVTLQEALAGIKVKEVMVHLDDLVSLSPGLSVKEAVNDYFLRYGYGGFPVMDNDKFMGMVTLKEIKQVARDLWPQMTIGEIYLPHDRKWELSPLDDIMKALQFMIQEDKGRIIVTKNDQVIGLVTRNGIARYLQIKREIS
ncbi:MAG: site-2 protease family protein [Thermodesulfobacteriota bacterium]